MLTKVYLLMMSISFLVIVDSEILGIIKMNVKYGDKLL